MSKFIVVEGNIGTGKSTVLPVLVESLNIGSDTEWVELQEPVDDPEFTRLLTKFYEDPTPENRIIFQKHITCRRHEMCKGLDTTKNYVLERSLLSDLTFSQANLLTTERPDGSYISYFYDIKDKLEDYPKLSACIYLSADPVKSFERIRQRGRVAEKDITLDYVTDIHNFHETCLPQICREYSIPLLKFDWSDVALADPRKVVREVKDLLEE